MGCKSSSLSYVTKDFALQRSGVPKFDAWFEEAEETVRKVIEAMAKISQAFDNFAMHTGMTAGHDHSLCFGILAMVCSAIATTHGNWNEVNLQFSDFMPGISMDASEYDSKLQDTCVAWYELSTALIEGQQAVEHNKYKLCEVLKKTRLAADYMAKDAFDNGTEISTFRSQESVAEENDRIVQQANGTFQNLALTIIEICQEAAFTIEGLCAYPDLSVLRKIARKAEEPNRAAPHLILQAIFPDLENLVREYKQKKGL